MFDVMNDNPVYHSELQYTTSVNYTVYSCTCNVLFPLKYTYTSNLCANKQATAFNLDNYISHKSQSRPLV